MAKTPKTITVTVMDGDERRELAELRAFRRLIGDVFDEWVSDAAAIMALYPTDLSWDEVIPTVANELREHRRLLVRLVDAGTINYNELPDELRFAVDLAGES